MKAKKVLKRQYNGREEGETPSKVKCTYFNVASFLTRLRTEDCLEALEEFVKLCKSRINKHNDPGVMFFKEGGQLMNILTVLDSGKCNDSFEVSKVFAALHSLLLRVLSQVPEKKQSAEEMCHRLLSSHLEHINKHVNVQSAPKLKKVVLQLLTAVVSLSVSLAKIVLSSVTLTVEDANEFVQLGKPNDKESIRTCFIHFLMSFLVEGNEYVINLLLLKRYVLTSIISGLRYDSSNTVAFVLTTLRTKIVECFHISKTVKMHTFNTRVVCQLLDLYKWKGPAAFVGRWEKIPQEEKMDVDVDEKQLNVVAEATHSLLLSLCTSIRYGILFRDRSLGFGERKNNIVASILTQMKKPWNHKLQTELVCKIVRACSELARIPYSQVNHDLEPRDTATWINIVAFITQVISAVDLRDLVNLKPDLALQAVKVLVCPGTFLSAFSNGITHPNPAIRHKCVLFFQAVLKASQSARSLLAEKEVSLLDSHIRKFLPDGATLENSWVMCAREKLESLTPQDLIPFLTNFDQMFALLDLMVLYQHHYVSLLDFVEKYVSLASSLVKTLDFENSSHSSILKLKIKVLQVLIQMDTNVIDPGEAYFSKALATLLHCSCCYKELAPEALSTLGSILVKYGVLDSTSTDINDELGVWIHCCQITEHDHREVILSFLQKMLEKVAINPSYFIDKISDSLQETSDTYSKTHQSLVDLAEKIFQELLEAHQDPFSKSETSADLEQKENLHFDKSNICEVSSLLMAALELVESKRIQPSVQRYLSVVLVHLLHIQIDPRSFLSVTKHWSSMPEGVAKYIYSWLGEEPVPLGDPFGKYSPECSLSRLFLQPNRAVPELEDSNHPISVLLMSHIVVFHVIQLAERQRLTETIVEGSSDVIVSLFRALMRINGDENPVLNKTQFKLLTSVFNHQGLVNYFSPIIQDESSSEAHVTIFLLSVLKKINKYPEILQNRSLTELLRKKCYKNILYYLEKPTGFTCKSNILVPLLECLHLNNNEKHSLIDKLLPCMLTNPWNEVFLYLLDHVDILHRHMLDISATLTRFLQSGDDTDKTSGWILCDTLSRYIEKFPSTANSFKLPPGMFHAVICEGGLNLAVTLYRHRNDCKKLFHKYLEKKQERLFKCPKVLFTILENCYLKFLNSPSRKLRKKDIKGLEHVYKCFGGDIEKAMQIPLSVPEYMTENSSCIKVLVKIFMGEKTCKELRYLLKKNYRNLGLCSPLHLYVIDGLHARGAWVKKPTSLVKLLLHQLIHMLKEKAPQTSIIQLCTIFVDVFTNSKNEWGSMLKPDETWNEIPILFLKIALKESEKIEENLSLSLLSVLNNLLWKWKCFNIAKLVFQMTTSHSRFLDIILKRKEDGIKLAVLQMIFICYQIAPQLMKSVHIPVWLGAYGASLSHCDQLILKILHCMHENKEINLNAYRPFLWGEAAVNHYSIRATAGMSLWRIPPATAAVELLNMEMVENTIARFPINRKLLIEKDNSESDKVNNNWCSESLHSCIPDVYDPAFILPLFNHLMSSESVLDDYKFCRLGGLALTLLCLGSRCRNIRAAALCVTARFYNHLEMRNFDMKSKFATIYEHFLEVLRCGLRDIKDRKNRLWRGRRVQEKEQDESKITDSLTLESTQMQWICRVPSFSSSFLAKSSLIILNPLHTMYGALQRFFMAKPVMNLLTIPELLELMRNSSLEYRYYQQWLLETVISGMRTEEDVTIANNHYFFTMALCLFSCSLSDTPTKVLILKIMETAINLKSIAFFTRGFIPWLYASCSQVYEANDGRLTIAFIRLLVSVSAHVTIRVKKAIPLLCKLPRRVDCKDLLPILQLVHISESNVSREHLVIILRLCYKVLDQDVIENCVRELMILSSDITTTINIHESGESEDTTKTSVNTENKDFIYKELRNIINTYVIQVRTKEMGNFT